MASTKLSYLTLIIAFFLLSFSANAQVEGAAILNFSKRTGKLKQKALASVDEGDYLLSQLYLEELVKRKPDNTKFQNELGKAYYFNREYALAAESLTKAIVNQEEAYLFLAAAKIRLGQYELAEIDYKIARKSLEYKKLNSLQKQIYTGVREDLEFFTGKKEIPLCLENKTAEVNRLNENINGKMTEFSPILLNKNTLFFGSTQPDNLSFYQKEGDETTAPRRNYFTAEKVGEEWSNVQAFSFKELKNETTDFGGASFNAAKNKMYLTICERKEDEFECHIYLSKKVKDFWSEPKMVLGRVNAEGYNSIQPIMTFDTLLKAEVLYFSSNKKGSRGYDLWYAVWSEDAQKFVTVSRCGNVINTGANEYAPFYVNDERLLYFSSDGHGGYGGLDIMRAQGITNEWETLQKLPKPINSSADDVYFYYNPEEETGFFSSNRSGVNNLEGKTCCEDLFYFQFVEKWEPVIDTVVALPDIAVSVPVILVVQDADKNKNLPLVMEIYKLEGGKKILVSDETLQQFIVNKVVPNKSNYSFVFKKEGYLTTSKDVDLSNFTELKMDTLNVELELVPEKAVVIPGINFEFDSDKLTKESTSILDEYIHRLMVDNLDINIRINAHTDSKGADDYNYTLSEKRAKSVVNYLIEKGIDKKRLQSKGFGETVPLAPNTNSDGSDNPEGRAKNRRIEFEIF